MGLLPSYKLNGFVGPAGFYGLFLIAPLIISFYLLHNENSAWPRRLWYFTTVIIFTSFFLTFAYLAWFILIAIILCTLFVYRKRLVNINKKSLFKSVLVLLTLSFILFCGIWYMARQSTMNQVRDQNFQSIQHNESDYRAVLILIILII
jgi:biotin transporter BioY